MMTILITNNETVIDILKETSGFYKGLYTSEKRELISKCFIK